MSRALYILFGSWVHRGVEAENELCRHLYLYLLANMSVGSPLLSPEFATLHAEEFSFLSDQSATMDSSDFFDLHTGDENFLSHNGVSFTPKRLKPQPRAWERKPSTPFAPRGEGQKIWKRFPLQNMATSINASWRKESSRGDGIMRPVKRLRVGASADDGYNGGVDYVVAKWDTEASPEKKGRRKAPIIYEEPASETDSSSSEEYAPSFSEQVESLPKETGAKAMPEECDQPALDEESTTQPKLKVAVQSEQSPRRRSPESSEGNNDAAAQLLEEADVFLRIFPQTSPTTSASTEAQSGPSPAHTETTELDEIMSPELDMGQLHNQGYSPEIQLKFEFGKEQLPEEQLLPALTYVDPDDTSYLQDFLLRSRAQKAAKIHPMQPIKTNHEKSTSTTSTDSEDGLFISKTRAATPGSPPPNPPIESSTAIDEDDDTEAKASSPCRRGSRTTRLPRPQKPSATLPSSIALRRLNGTEFISIQREAQSLAVTTRGNTRKNRGGGVGVKARLLQLKSEADSDADTLVTAEDVPNKIGKRISWAETLAKFQEFNEIPPSSSSDTEAPEQAPEQSPRAVAEIQEVTADPEEKRSTRRVKRLRKESAGSVNGTPAPKRSIEILLEDAAQTTGQTTGPGSDQTGKRTRSRTRS